MRKSNKKLRSERINSLRKQYDAFLEEDKQRRERNCFILERLDKIRFNSTAIQLRDSRKIYTEPQPDTHNSISKQVKNYVDYNSQLTNANLSNVPKDILDETLMIQEISKKFILIPKINSSPMRDYVPSIKYTNTNDSEWKHKYEILNQLKKNEITAEEPVQEHEKDYIYTDNNDKKDLLNEDLNTNSLLTKNYNLNKDLESDTIDELITKPLLTLKNQYDDIEEVPVLLTIDKSEPVQDISVNNLLSKDNVFIDKIQSVCNDDKITDNTFKADNESKLSINEQEVYHTVDNNYIETVSEHIKPHEFKLGFEENVLIDDSKNVQNINHLNENDIKDVQTLNPNQFETKIINDYVEEFPKVNDVKSPKKATNNPDFTPTNNYTLQEKVNVSNEGYSTDPVDSSYQNNPALNINQGIVDSTMINEPQAENIPENNDNADIISDIEAFDTEQREMFYSEQSEENTYEQYDANAYNQEYTDNLNYQENTEYYEGVNTEQAYPTEVNEHEETSQRYDQNYEEQYSNYEQEAYEQQDYGEPQQYEQSDQNEQPQITGVIQPEVEQLQYEQQNYETQEQLEEQLDQEQGIIKEQVIDEPREEFQVQAKQTEPIIE